MYANGHLAKSLYFCFLKIGLQLFKALQPFTEPQKQGLDAQWIYHKALKEMFKHFPKAVPLEIKMYAIRLEKIKVYLQCDSFSGLELEPHL